MMCAYAYLVNKNIEGITMNVFPSGGASENVNLLKDDQRKLLFKLFIIPTML
ncbi:hypothetical protein V7149_05115 [Bacillus sp. JJ1503]|uniref:hypothetical protein n=1 Tax=Bacillus sp. JJ1503 TaxID=3122956 RepID=UPI002FFFE260